MHWRREWPGTSDESDGLCTTARGSSWWKSTKGIAGNVQATQVEGVYMFTSYRTFLFNNLCKMRDGVSVATIG